MDSNMDNNNDIGNNDIDNKDIDNNNDIDKDIDNNKNNNNKDKNNEIDKVPEDDIKIQHQKVINILKIILNIPSATTIVEIQSKRNIDANIISMLQAIRTIESLVSVLVAYSIYGEHKEEFDITNPSDVADLIFLSSKWRDHILNSGSVKLISTFLPNKSVLSNKYSDKIEITDINKVFLKELFDGYHLSSHVNEQISSIFEEVTTTLKGLKFKEDEKPTVDQFITYYSFVPIGGTGGDSGIPTILECKARTIYFHLDVTTWKKQAKAKKPFFSDKKKPPVTTTIEFNMHYSVMDTILMSDNVKKSTDNINSIVTQITGLNLTEIQNLVSQRVISEN